MARLVSSAQELAAYLEEAGRKLVIIDFFASWCAPCKVMAPVLDGIAEGDAEGLVVLKVDINQCEDLAEEYGISAMPTFVFLRHKKVVGTYVGANVAKFRDKIALLKAGLAGRADAESGSEKSHE